MKRKSPLTLLVFLVSLVVLSVCPAGAEQLKFGYDEYPPLSYTRDGQAIGYSLDLVREASNRLGIEPVFVGQPFIRLLDSVRDGTIDGMVDLYETPARAEFLYFGSKSATSEYIRLYVRRDSRIRIKSLDDAKRYKVGAVRGYYYGELVDDELRSRLSLVRDCKVLYRMLLEGRFDAVVGNSMAARHYMGASLEHCDILPVLELAHLEYHVAFSKTLGPRGRELAERYAKEIARIVRERGGSDALR